MININKVKGIIFDYGATIDTNGVHWAEVLWKAYQGNQVPVTKQQFRDAYVYGERYLALHPAIKHEDNFHSVLIHKTTLQINHLVNSGFLARNEETSAYPLAISNQCYNFVVAILNMAKPVLNKLSRRYPLVLVSNFYGNVQTVLKDFELETYFEEIVESAVVGVRKPDPAIFSLGVKALGLAPQEVVVVGDSYRKDIVPAKSIGCQTIWLKGPGWEDDEKEATANCIISDFKELADLLF